MAPLLPADTRPDTMALDGSDIERLTNNRKPDLFPDWQVLNR